MFIEGVSDLIKRKNSHGCRKLEKAAEIAKGAHKEHKSLKEKALETGYIKEELFDQVVRPELMVKPSVYKKWNDL